jgi:hypothetical protein
MPTLILGVNDIPYDDADGKTTGDVAEILEEEYGIMQYFYDKNSEDIADNMANAMTGALEDLLSGKPMGKPPLQQACSDIESRFRKFLDNQEMDGKPGVPTMASIEGISHRLKNKKINGKKIKQKVKIKDRPGRPSFIDTGLYQACFAVSVDMK